MKLSKKFFANFFLICLVVVFIIVLGKFGNVKASTSYTTPGSNGNCSMTGQVDLNKTTYYPGEQITATATAYMNVNGGGGSCNGGVTATDDGNVTYHTLISNLSGGSANGQTYFTAASSGTHTIYFTASSNGGVATPGVMYAVSTGGGGGGGTPVVTVWATPVSGGSSIDTATYGQVINVHWTSTSSTSCSAAANGTSVPNGGTGVTGNFTQAPLVDTTYTVTCSNGSDVGSGSKNIKVIPLVTVTPNPAQVTSGSSSNVIWTSAGAASCTSANGGGTGVTGNFNVTPPANPPSSTYSVTCSEANQVIPGTCSGTYQPASTVCEASEYPNSNVYLSYLPPENGNPLGTGTQFCNSKLSSSSCAAAQASNGTDPVEHICYWTAPGSCHGTVVGSICSGGGNPDEGMDCGEFEQGECPGNVDPWCHHGCSWHPAGNSPVSCSGLSQTLCTSHSTCVWTAGSTIPGDSNTGSGTVTVVNTRSVLTGFPLSTPSMLHSITISKNTSTQLAWSATGFSNNNPATAHCNVYNSDGSIVKTGNNPAVSLQGVGLFNPGVMLENQSDNNVFTVKCYEDSAPLTLYTDPTPDQLIVVTPIMPDLLVTGYNIPDSATVNTNVTLQATIGNQGGVQTPTDFYNFFQITDIDQGMQAGLFNKSKNSLMAMLFPKAFASMGIIDVPTNLSGIFMDSLGSQAEDTTSTTYKFTTAGDYWVRACADKKSRSDVGLINESDENNNCGVWNNILINPPTPMPDLIAQSSTPGTAIKDSATTFSSVIKNRGNYTTGSAFSNFFQVTDVNPGGQTSLLNKSKNSLMASLTPKAYAAMGIVDLPSSSMNTLAAGASDTATVSYTFSNTGTYWMRACADKTTNAGGGVITESNEANNCGAWTVVTVVNAGSGLPDLTAGSITPTTAVASTFPITFHAPISNIGVVSTGSFKNFAQVSTKPNPTPAQIIDLAPVSMAPIGAGLTSIMNIPFKSNVADVYYARVCADMSNRNTNHTSTPPDSVLESDENNNCGPITTITITAPNTTGNISASDCTVAAGLGSCDSAISWNTVNPQTGYTSSVTTNPNKTVGTGNSGIATWPVTIAEGSRDFYLYHHSVQLDQATAKASCVKGTVYDDKKFICKNSDSKPDLTASAVGPSIVAPDTQFNFFTSIQNLNGISTGDSFENLFEVSDKSDGSDAQPMDPTVQITPYLGPNSSMTIYSPLYGPLSVNQVKYVRACADNDKQHIGTIDEGTKEGNNCGPWSKITAVASFDGKCAASHWACDQGASGNPVTGTNSYTWTCFGAGTGLDASCVENIVPVNGQCDTAHWGCIKGTSGSQVTGTTSYNWLCSGTGGGTNASCSESIVSHSCPAGLYPWPTCDQCMNGQTPPLCIGGGEPETCHDKKKDGDEKGVDCGGSCILKCKIPKYIER